MPRLDHSSLLVRVMRWLVAALVRRPDPIVAAWDEIGQANESPSADDWEADLVAEYADTSVGHRIMAFVDRTRPSVRRPITVSRMRARARSPRRSRTRTAVVRAAAADPPSSSDDDPAPRAPRRGRGS